MPGHKSRQRNRKAFEEPWNRQAWRRVCSLGEMET